MNNDHQTYSPFEEKPEPDEEGRQPDYDEAWADFAGLSAETKWFMEEQHEQVMNEHGGTFEELPQAVQEQMLRDESVWAASYGGNGLLAQQLYNKDEEGANPYQNSHPEIEAHDGATQPDAPKSDNSSSEMPMSLSERFMSLFKRQEEKEFDEREPDMDIDKD